MGSLREVKNRINSVKNTRKITSAMHLVASSKLTKVEGIIAGMITYQNKRNASVGERLSSSIAIESPFVEEREVKRVAILAIASNTALCGSYNVSVLKELSQQLEIYQHLGKENILVYPLGKKVEEFIKKKAYTFEESFQTLVEKPSYKQTRKLAYELINLYLNHDIDRIVLIYHHFKSLSSQQLLVENYLPLELSKFKNINDSNQVNIDYIVEPSEEELIIDLLPKVLSQKLFSVLVDSNAAEHAARSMAMQIATDNANELIQDLTIQYNKSRQQAITNELLDIVGGSMR